MKPEEMPQIISKDLALERIQDAMSEMIAVHGTGGEEVSRLKTILDQLARGELSVSDALPYSLNHISDIFYWV